MALPLSLLLVPLQQPAGTTALIAMAGVRAQSAAFWEAVQGRESECPKVSQNPDWIFPKWKSIPFPVTSEKGEKVSGWLSQHKLRPSSSCKCPCSSDGLCAKAASVRWNFFFFKVLLKRLLWFPFDRRPSGHLMAEAGLRKISVAT